ncbi:PEP-CTERM sorting domain-containing protein [Marinobacter fonticola]|uniref:PEP-CTERM sorting domain-containing protein n=1 Tax=Marinobacter fonticola TaxID=2603215 RepID=UPI001D0D839C|nr:PEP-CTERM sorting domain-containing protein [Marinobacter fonticola]
MLKNQKVLAAAVSLSLAGAAGTAAAKPIEGTLLFAGQAEYLNEAGKKTESVLDAREIQFQSQGDDTEDNASLVGVEGDFANTLSIGDSGQFNDLVFNPPYSVEGDSLWSFGDFSFALSSMEIVNQEETFLSLYGEGTLSSTLEGYEDTDFVWSFSSDATGNNGGTFAFSSTATENENPSTDTPSEVPEPATLALFGLGLAGIGAAKGRKKAA